MPAQPFGPRRTRWDQITSKTEMLITHVLCGFPPAAAGLALPMLRTHHGVWKASVNAEKHPDRFPNQPK